MKLTSLLQGLALGAGAMYLMDPERGKRRQALIRDQVTHQLNVKRKALKVMRRDFKNRSQGWMHQAQGKLSSAAVDDTILIERIRSAIGRCCTNTHAIQIECHDGEVTLSGQALSSEVTELIGTVKHVGGVTKVVNDLELQSGNEIAASQTSISRWAPGECLVAVSAGAILSIYGLGRRGVVGWLLGFGGATLIAKGFRDTEHRFERGRSGSTGEQTDSPVRARVA